MLEVNMISKLQDLMLTCMEQDVALLSQLRKEVSVLAPNVKRIFPRNTTSISLVGTDGGNNKLQFDPFVVQVIRVVDSSNNEYYMDVITPTTPIHTLNNKIADKSNLNFDALRKMMDFLGVDNLTKLSPMINEVKPGEPVKTSWVQVYRELVEWATLFSLIRDKEFGTDTLIVFDGQLRSKVFTQGLFAKLKSGIEDAIVWHHKTNKRKIYIVGVAKHSKVLERYRLAMHLDNIMTTTYPCYVDVPREIEAKAYIWNEYAKDDEGINGGEINKFVAGKMFFVKFGSGKQDPIWPIDLFTPQIGEAQTILGYLLADALNGFPVPFYPLSLQKAHENAALVDFDMDIIQSQVLKSIRVALDEESPKLDSYLLIDQDPASKRY